MDRCSVCKLRYHCAGKHQFDCEFGNYKFYMPDEKAIEEAKKELCAMSTIKWKKGTEPLPVELKEKKDMEEKYYIVKMKDGKEFAFLERTHSVELEHGLLKIMGGYDLTEVEFVASNEQVLYMVLSTLN